MISRVSIIAFQDKLPLLADDVFLAEGVRIIGDVVVREECGIWYNSVLRGDVNAIRIGKCTNIQDGSVIHVDHVHAAIIGDGVTVGHNVILHGCEVGANCLIGMGAIVLSGARIGENSIVGAGTVVTQGKVIPPNSLVIGTPGKIIRQITGQEIADIKDSAKHYHELRGQYSFNK
ncbi:MAG: ferripyochelin binding protein (fbp) [Firmicutes bacterium]|nr:ferripyochelin binding protein (fbp) [Bacillota bacterium]